jgi:hypothetical protein
LDYNHQCPLTLYFVQKKNIFTIIVSAVLLGSLSGGVTSYWVVQSYLSGESETIASVVESTFVEESLLIDAHEKASPAVFSIIEYVSLEQLRSQYYGTGPFGGFPAAEYDPDQDGYAEAGGGTGFLIDPTGIGLTNKHVVSSEDGRYVAIYLNLKNNPKIKTLEGDRYKLTA